MLSSAELELDQTATSTRKQVIERIKTHSLSSVFQDGTVICGCGHISNVVMFTDHLVQAVGRG